jgi:hypothetical protein
MKSPQWRVNSGSRVHVNFDKIGHPRAGRKLASVNYLGRPAKENTATHKLDPTRPSEDEAPACTC